MKRGSRAVASQSVTIFSNSAVRHAGMGHHDQFDHAVLTGFGERLHVPVEHRLERLLVLPFRMQRAPCAFTRSSAKASWTYIGCSHPQRAVVVEGGDALVDGDEVGPALRGDAVDKLVIAVLVAPSFQDGNSAPGVCAIAEESSAADSAGSAVMAAIKARRSIPEERLIVFMIGLPLLVV